MPSNDISTTTQTPTISNTNTHDIFQPEKRKNTKRQGEPNTNPKSNRNEESDQKALVHSNKISAKNFDDEKENCLYAVTNHIINDKIPFYPPKKAWMVHRIIGLQLSDDTNKLMCFSWPYFGTERKITISSEPSIIHPIVADGNCLFKWTSYVLTGSEDYHLPIRKAAINQIKNNDYTAYNSTTLGLQYASQTKMNLSGTLSTEKEIFALCDILKCHIYVFQDDTKKWIKFSPIHAQHFGLTSIYLVRKKEFILM
ncbi:unnamed protein product [Didymodactylos carnosus]|uniref:OTU domain-containing protein n=1 Tax=Didymodactylos carnosus TaxID=1234261 RepID=A0A815PL64_9BILA|nr:unnamed protein product [Didymodactylos carnosus]CAF1450509.1 unnamed protein product [Didymodactylos carnosus]CAF4100700.1 unnamed protein product [Didymodactylos carnosus]CAF4323973.1 unnamed protein product [Didymodactylos carnosus]